MIDGRKITIRNFLRGFTLIEAVLAMGIASLIGLAIITFQITVIRNTQVLQANLSSQREVKKIFNNFIVEMRSAQQSSAGGPAIALAGTSSIIFYADIDGDAAIERLRYYIGTTTAASSTIIYKAILKPTGAPLAYTGSETTSIIVTDVKNGTSTNMFSYYDKNYDGSTGPLSQPVNTSEIRLIKMTISVDPNSARSPTFQTYTTQVTVRNLKDNY